MKNLLFPLLLLVLALPLRAQTMTGAPDSSGAPAQGAPSLPRMPTAINHKPNPTPPPAEIAVPSRSFSTP